MTATVSQSVIRTLEDYGLWSSNESDKYCILVKESFHEGGHITDTLRSRSHIMSKVTF